MNYYYYIIINNNATSALSPCFLQPLFPYLQHIYTYSPSRHPPPFPLLPPGCPSVPHIHGKKSERPPTSINGHEPLLFVHATHRGLCLKSLLRQHIIYWTVRQRKIHSSLSGYQATVQQATFRRGVGVEYGMGERWISVPLTEYPHPHSPHTKV